MTSNFTTLLPTGVLYKNDDSKDTQNVSIKNEYKYKREIIWKNIIFYILLHIATLYGVYLTFTSAKIATLLLAFLFHLISVMGITAGVHRLWAHRSYKATKPLIVILLIFNTVAFQDSVINWARNHRLHHKYSDTDADPHNANRGLVFSHIGWQMYRKHPAVKEKGKGIDLSDLYNDPILKFQKKYYIIMVLLFCFLLPTIIPMYLWNEAFTNSFYIAAIMRYTFGLHVAFLVNSVAHRFGNKPYDRYIKPTENLALSLVTLGEGYHNFHHVFPWDYHTAELGNFKINLTTAFIEFFAKIGWAYDLKTVSTDMIKKRVQRTGDGSHEIWGWGDKDQSQEERDDAIVTHSRND